MRRHPDGWAAVHLLSRSALRGVAGYPQGQPAIWLVVFAEPAEVIRNRIGISRGRGLRRCAADTAAILFLNLAAKLHFDLLDAGHRLGEDLVEIAAHPIGIAIGIEAGKNGADVP